jgi:hypothetical protein
MLLHSCAINFYNAGDVLQSRRIISRYVHTQLARPEFDSEIRTSLITPPPRKRHHCKTFFLRKWGEKSSKSGKIVDTSRVLRGVNIFDN